MLKPLGLNIADVQINLTPISPDCGFSIDERFIVFKAEGPADVNIRIRCDPMPVQDTNDLVFDTALGWRMYQRDGQWVIETGISRSDPFQMGFFDRNFRRGDIFVRKDPETNLYYFPLRRTIGEIYFINLLSRGLGLFLHSCGIDDRGAGLIFTGRGGAGKTTLARLWNQADNAHILSDDRVIIRESDGQFWAYGTPWPGQAGIFSNTKVPLSKIFLISHASENKIRKLTQVEAASRLLITCFAPHWDPVGMEFILSLLEKLVKTVPCYELGFTPDERVIKFVRCIE